MMNLGMAGFFGGLAQGWAGGLERAQDIADRTQMRKAQQQEIEMRGKQIEFENRRLELQLQQQSQLQAIMGGMASGQSPDQAMGEAGMQPRSMAAQQALQPYMSDPRYQQAARDQELGRKLLAVDFNKGMSMIKEGSQAQASVMKEFNQQQAEQRKQDKDAWDKYRDSERLRIADEAAAARQNPKPGTEFKQEQSIYNQTMRQVKPIEDIRLRMSVARNLVDQGTPLSDKQLQQSLVDVFTRLHATNRLYEDQANFGTIADRLTNMVSKFATGEYSEQSRGEIRSMLDDMEKNLMTPTYNSIVDGQKELAKRYGLNPDNVIPPSYSGPSGKKAAAPAGKEAPAKAMTFTPVQEDWISRAVKANPGATREQIIEAAKKAGRL